jgi:hypothetical protein
MSTSVTIKSKYGRNVPVDHKILKTANNLHVIELRATSGSTTEIKKVTIGANDGPRTTVSTADLQKILDTQRQAIADEADWKESIAVGIKGVV